MQKIKILTGWSNPGGSTVAHINLCNLFNASGYDCTLYGPNTWHLDKCKAAGLNAFEAQSNDIILYHCLQLKEKLKVQKTILSCHETNIFPIKKTNYKVCDFIHFVSNSQKLYHKVNWPSVVIPNVISDLKNFGIRGRAAGVIGSIDRHKQTHLSIQRALDDGHDKVYLFGLVTDQPYFEASVSPLIQKHPNIIYAGHQDDKQAMYNSISDVYHSSLRETFNFVQFECQAAGVAYHGLDSSNSGATPLANEEILQTWQQYLN